LEWSRGGETWIAVHHVKRLYKINLEELTEEGIRFEIFTNPHNEKTFRAYSVFDLERYVSKKRKQIQEPWF